MCIPPFRLSNHACLPAVEKSYYPNLVEAPVTSVAAAVQMYVVPATLFGLEITIEVDSPEHIVWSVADALVTGRTVTTKFTGVPSHPPLVGLME